MSEDRLREALQRLSKAVVTLGKFKGDKLLLEIPASQDSDSYAAWIELNQAQRQAREALAAAPELGGREDE